MKYNNTTAAILCSAFVALNGQEAAASAAESPYRSASQASYREYCGRDLQNLRDHATALGKTAIRTVKSYAALSKDLDVPTIICNAILIFNSANKTDATLSVIQMTAALPLTQNQKEETSTLEEQLKQIKKEKENTGIVKVETKLGTTGQVLNTVNSFIPTKIQQEESTELQKGNFSAVKSEKREMKISEEDVAATEKLSRIGKNVAALVTSTIGTCKETVRTAYDVVKVAARSIHWTYCKLGNKLAKYLSGKKAGEKQTTERRVEIVNS